MPSILFLVNNAGPAHNDNHLRLPSTFTELGWHAVSVDHDDLRWDGRDVLTGDLDAGRFDLIWMLGFGRRESYYDRMQLLRRLDQGRFVNPVDAYTYLHGKLPPDESLAEHIPESHAAASARYLLECLDNRTPWVLKPSGASFGRDVSLVQDNAEGRRAVRKLIERDGFALLQRYVPSIERGEVRCLLAGGEIVGCYKRRRHPGDIRVNLAAGGRAERHDLTGPERTLAEAVARRLTAAGVGFAAVDFAWPYLIETNIANPGGLATLESMTGTDPTARTVGLIARMHRLE